MWIKGRQMIIVLHGRTLSFTSCVYASHSGSCVCFILLLFFVDFLFTIIFNQVWSIIVYTNNQRVFKACFECAWARCLFRHIHMGYGFTLGYAILLFFLFLLTFFFVFIVHFFRERTFQSPKISLSFHSKKAFFFFICNDKFHFVCR